MRYPLTDTLYGYRQSRTDFLEYQYLPVLKILENPDQRLLIADEVGLGKTIEAGYIYQELAARIPLDGVLVVCPASLCNKWRQEFIEKFDVEFKILDGGSLQRLINESEASFYPHHYRAIVSYETIRRYNQQVSEKSFTPDLVIFDEAHYMRNKNPTNEIGVLLADSATAVVMLSATPLQTGTDNLFQLFHLMKPDEYEEFREFENIIEPNRHLNQAARLLQAGHARDALLNLRNLEQVTHYDYFRGNPDYHAVMERLEALDGVALAGLTLDGGAQDGAALAGAAWDEAARAKQKLRREVIQLSRAMLKLNTLSPLFQRTRKREVVYETPGGEKIPPPKRRARVVEVPMTEVEADFYQSLMKDAIADLERRQVRHIGFARTTRERMAASCLPALRRQCLRGETATFQVERSVYDDPDTDDENGATRRGRRSAPREDGDAAAVKWTFSEKSRRLARELGQQDSKFAKLAPLIEELLDQQPEPELRHLGPSKILLFASYLGTLDYLYERLLPLFEERGLRLELVHGGVKNLDRQKIQDEFRDEADFRLLLSSEVSSEGIDLQFCNTIINYDMPWNPMRIEQRIGRLDRYKQRHPIILICNFYLDSDIDSRILRRLHERIDLFESSIGDLEMILGPVIREIQQKLLEPNLSEEELREFLEREADSLEHQRQIQQEYEERAAELLGPDLVLRSEIDDAQSSGRIIHREEVRALLETYLEAECPDSYMERFQGTDQYALQTGPQLHAKLTEFMAEKRRQGLALSPPSQRLREALERGSGCFVTFGSDEAQYRHNFEFINYLHPLTQLACEYWSRDYRGLPSLSGIALKAAVEQEQDGYYFLFVMQEASMRPRRVLVPLIIGEDGRAHTAAAEQVLGQLHNEKGVAALPGGDERWQAAAEQAYRWIDEQRDRQAKTSQGRNDALLRARESGIRRQFSAKIERRREYLRDATDERIKRMRSGEIRRLEAQLDERLRQLMSRREVSVSYELVASGRVRLLPEKPKALPADMVISEKPRALPAESEIAEKVKEQPAEAGLPEKAKELPATAADLPEKDKEQPAAEAAPAERPRPLTISQRRKRRRERKRKRRAARS